jgi:hypothetical protein
LIDSEHCYQFGHLINFVFLLWYKNWFSRFFVRLGVVLVPSSSFVSMVVLWLSADGTIYMFDCGEGVQRQLHRTPFRHRRIDNITHMHGDHVSLKLIQDRLVQVCFVNVEHVMVFASVWPTNFARGDILTFSLTRRIFLAHSDIWTSRCVVIFLDPLNFLFKDFKFFFFCLNSLDLETFTEIF